MADLYTRLDTKNEKAKNIPEGTGRGVGRAYRKYVS